MKSHKPYFVSFYTIFCAIFLQGCVAQHGVDFGHWALTAERRQLIRVKTESEAWLSQTSTIVMLPVLGNVPKDTATRFQTQLCLNLQDHGPINLVMTTEDASESPLLKADNLLRPGGAPRLSEIAGAGKVFDTSHVLCISITDYSPYPPQKIYFTAWLVNVSDRSLASTISGAFDASEQQTVMALGSFMQSRRARPFDDTHLDIMLQSPAEYADFVCAYAARHIASQMVSTGLMPGHVAFESKEELTK